MVWSLVQGRQSHSLLSVLILAQSAIVKGRQSHSLLMSVLIKTQSVFVKGRQSHSLLSVLIQAQSAFVMIGRRHIWICIWIWAAQVEQEEVQPLDLYWMPLMARVKLVMDSNHPS